MSYNCTEKKDIKGIILISKKFTKRIEKGEKITCLKWKNAIKRLDIVDASNINKFTHEQ